MKRIILPALIFLILASSLSLAVDSVKSDLIFDIYKIEQQLQNLTTQGIPVERIQDSISSADEYIRAQKYELANESIRLAKQEMENALYTTALITEINQKIEQAEILGINTNQIQLKFEIGVNNYEQSKFAESITQIELLRTELNSLLAPFALIIVEDINKLTGVAGEAGLSTLYMSELSSNFSAIIEWENYELILQKKEEVALLNSTLDSYVSFTEQLNQFAEKYSSNRFRDLNTDLISLWNQNRFEEASIEVDKALALMETAHQASEQLFSFEQKLSTKEEGSAESENFGELAAHARSEFEAENYEDALILISGAFEELEEHESKNLLMNVLSESRARFNLVAYFRRNWMFIVPLLLITLISSRSIYIFLLIRKNRFQEKRIAIEKEKITQLIKELQRNYFVAKTISKTEYQDAIKGHQERLATIETSIPLIGRRLERLESKKRKDILLRWR